MDGERRQELLKIRSHVEEARALLFRVLPLPHRLGDELQRHLDVADALAACALAAEEKRLLERAA